MPQVGQPDKHQAMSKILLSAIAILLSLGLGAMYYIDEEVDEIKASQGRISNNIVPKDSIKLKSGDRFTGKVIGQSDKALLLKVLVYGQQDKNYNFPYQDLKEITFGDIDHESKLENPLLDAFYETEIFKRKILNHYNDLQFEALEKIIDLARIDKQRYASGEWKLDVFYKSLSQPYRKIHVDRMLQNVAVLEQWRGQFPDSITPVILLLEAHKNIAWQYRGTTFSGGVAESGWKKFKEHLTIALDLITAAESDKKFNDPYFYQSTIAVYKGLDLLDQKIAGIVKNTNAYDAEYFTNYARLAPFLMPRWGGYPGGVEAFAKWSSLQSDSNEAYARVANNIRQYAGHSSYKKFDFDWEKIKAGYDLILRKYPTAFYQLHSYAWMACYYEDLKLAKELTDKIEYSWNNQANRVWKRFEKYYECRAMANLDSDNRQVSLHKEIRSGNYNHFVDLISGDIDLNTRNDKKETPLNYALSSRFDDFAQALIDRGANLRLASFQGEEPIHKAAKNGRRALVKLLIEKGVPVNTSLHPHYWTALHYAVRYGQIGTIKLLLDQDDIDVNIKNSLGRTPLHLAVKNGEIVIVKLLLTHDTIDVNIADFRNNTPLNLVQAFDYPEIEKLLESSNAIANSDIVTDASVKLANDFLQQGMDAHNNGSYKKARELYGKAVETHSGNTYTYGNIALLDMHEEDYEACLENTDKALKIYKRNSHAIYTAGQCVYLQKKSKHEYLAYYRQYIKLQPDNFRTKELLQKYPELKKSK